jgi:hypothetical protein
VVIWEIVHQINLVAGSEDDIVWHWTADGEYTLKSAYQIQFEGTFCKLKMMPIWKTKAEPKCRFFAWTLLHKKILIANNLIKQQWPNDSACKLYGSDLETPTHLCKDCNFTRQVWTWPKGWFDLLVLDTINTNGLLHNYWRKCRVKIDRARRCKFDGLMIYFWWNLWKERNRRMFQHKSL